MTLRTRKMEQGFTLIEIMIAVAIIAALAAIAIPQLQRARMMANDSLAKSTLRAMSTAAESYWTFNSNYPASESALIGAAPPYLNTSYCANSPVAGYNYDCTGMSASGYIITATPVNTGVTGSTVETIATGGVLTP